MRVQLDASTDGLSEISCGAKFALNGWQVQTTQELRNRKAQQFRGGRIVRTHRKPSLFCLCSETLNRSGGAQANTRALPRRVQRPTRPSSRSAAPLGPSNCAISDRMRSALLRKLESVNTALTA